MLTISINRIGKYLVTARTFKRQNVTRVASAPHLTRRNHHRAPFGRSPYQPAYHRFPCCMLFYWWAHHQSPIRLHRHVLRYSQHYLHLRCQMTYTWPPSWHQGEGSTHRRRRGSCNCRKGRCAGLERCILYLHSHALVWRGPSSFRRLKIKIIDALNLVFKDLTGCSLKGSWAVF